ncbi:hypothetical protein HN51_024447 [Arachis hypogaea]|nr:uncharacterized protein DS421_7g208470 [Arachis hypogaea]
MVSPTIILLLLCFIFSFSSSVISQPPPDTGFIKCGSCPCGTSCSGGDQFPPLFPLFPPPPPSTPPPLPLPDISSPPEDDCSPPVSPPPPPPSPPPPRPPPPPPSPPPPTPPPPRFIYVTGVPADVYNYYSSAQNRVVGLVALVSLGLLSVAMMFG